MIISPQEPSSHGGLEMNGRVESHSDYWDGFYGKSKKVTPLGPSQFAAFAATEFCLSMPLIEFGCGSGRDSEFFSRYGFRVYAFDASPEAIKLCQNRSQRSVVYARELAGSCSDHVVEHLRSGPCSIYGRFFLHAIDEREHHNFFKMLSENLTAGSQVAFEYRTVNDERNLKEFGDHYRRYIDHDDLVRSLGAFGLTTTYEVQGVGFAKYGKEDAHVGRCIALKR
jgi:tellurite methyltransferase